MRRFVVVTPVFNGLRFLPETLLSIDRQNWPNWIHVVVDGGSTDGTVEVVRQSVAAEARRQLIIGRDRGIYDAIFKGFDAVQPRPDDVLLWLNADDMLAPWAFNTMAAAFEAGADWVSALPGQWDQEGRLTHIIPSAWYPQALVRRGWFHGRALGWIQQESTFFSRRLLDLADPIVIARIRGLKYAGDFALWREFARYAPLVGVTTVIGGFRLHATNASAAQERYFIEAIEEGAVILPRAVGNVLRRLFRLVALVKSATRARQVSIAEERRVRG